MKPLLLLLLLSPLFATQKQYLYALKLYYDQNSTLSSRSIPLLKEIANKEHSDACFLLGVAYSEGRIVKKDIKLALYWYQKASTLGDRDAMMITGWLYYEDGSLQRAREWFQKAYDLGDAEALEMIDLTDETKSFW